jgi:DNA-binding response OmpR family regulator
MNSIDWKELRILVVEDEEELRDVLCNFIRKRGASVFSACNGIEGFAVIEQQNIDIVISDVQMPHCSGVELVEKIRKIHPRVPVVFLTTGFADINEKDALASGASALIQKPFKMASLVPLVESVLLKKGHIVEI